MRKCFDQPYAQQEQESRLLDWFIPDKANGRALLLVHGGGWSGGSRQQWHGVAEYFAERGYTCASASYRLAPAGSFDDQISDVRLAMQQVRKAADDYGFRRDRVGAVGSSAGGHLVAMLGTIAADDALGAEPELTQRHTRPDAVVCYCPVTLVYHRGELHGYYSSTIQQMIGAPQEAVPARYRQASPLDRITGEEPPFIFIHGDVDETVPLWHSAEMHRQLLEADRQSRLVVLTGAAHGFGYGAVSAHQLLAVQHIDRFLTEIWS